MEVVTIDSCQLIFDQQADKIVADNIIDQKLT